MRKRVLSMALAILAFFIFVASPFQQSANAVALVDDALIAIIIAALAAFGITFAMSDGYYNAYDWVASQINDSGADFTGINVGVNSLSNLLLNNKFVRELSLLATYIKVHYNLQDNATKQMAFAGIAAVDELTGNLYYPGTVQDFDHYTEGTELFRFNSYHAANGDYYYYYRFSGTYYRFRITQMPGSPLIYLEQSDDSVNWTSKGSVQTGGDMSFQLNYNNGKLYLYQIIKYRDGTSNDWMGVANRWVEIQGAATGYDLWIKTGIIQIPDGVQIDDNGGILSLPVPWGETYGEVIDSIPGLTENDELAGNTTLTLEGASVVEGQVDQAATNQPFVSQNVNDYRSPGLQSVFPFCIPFDIYAFFECLAAEPEAPSFVWRFYIPGICDEDIEIDLAAFDSAARILRTMELLLFIVGLAFVTRDKFLRG